MQEYEYILLNYQISFTESIGLDNLRERLRKFAMEGYRVINISSSPFSDGDIHMFYTLEREKKE